MKNQYVFYERKAFRSKVEKLTGESKKSNVISVEINDCFDTTAGGQ